MKALSKSIYIPATALIAGAAGMLARLGLYATGFDDRGLLVENHPLYILCWVIAAAAGVFLAVSLRKLDGSNSYRDNFPASATGAVGCFAAAGWLLINAFSLLDQATGKIDMVRVVLAFAAVPCLAFTGYCRLKGKRPSFLFHGVVCLYCAAELLLHCHAWSGNPQIPDYCFQLFACIFLTLTAYQHAAFDAGLGRRRMQVFCSLMAAMLCLISLAGPGESYFYFGGAVWSITNLCPFDPPARRHRPEPEQPEEA